MTDTTTTPEPERLSPTQADHRAVRGIEHVGITVPDIELASGFLVAAFGAEPLYDLVSPEAPPLGGAETEAQLGLDPGARISHMRMLRLGNGANVELFRFDAAPQSEPARLQDFGLTHLAVYVDDIDGAAQAVAAAGGTLLPGPHPLAGVEDRPGNRGIYARAPWGMLIELITYPAGIDYPDEAPARRWVPGE